MANKQLDDIRLPKEELSSISPANQKLMSDLERGAMEYFNHKMRLEKQIEAKKQQYISKLNKGLNNSDPKVKMFAANLYNQIN